jgi:hypothetical protein
VPELHLQTAADVPQRPDADIGPGEVIQVPRPGDAQVAAGPDHSDRTIGVVKVRRESAAVVHDADLPRQRIAEEEALQAGVEQVITRERRDGNDDIRHRFLSSGPARRVEEWQRFRGNRPGNKYEDEVRDSSRMEGVENGNGWLPTRVGSHLVSHSCHAYPVIQTWRHDRRDGAFQSEGRPGRCLRTARRSGTDGLGRPGGAPVAVGHRPGG